MTRVEDLADMTLIDENTKLILTDNMINDANKAIPSNMTMHVAPPGGQISYLYKWSHLVAKFLTYTSSGSFSLKNKRHKSMYFSRPMCE